MSVASNRSRRRAVALPQLAPVRAVGGGEVRASRSGSRDSRATRCPLPGTMSSRPPSRRSVPSFFHSSRPPALSAAEKSAPFTFTRSEARARADRAEGLEARGAGRGPVVLHSELVTMLGCHEEHGAVHVDELVGPLALATADHVLNEDRARRRAVALPDKAGPVPFEPSLVKQEVQRAVRNDRAWATAEDSEVPHERRARRCRRRSATAHRLPHGRREKAPATPPISTMRVFTSRKPDAWVLTSFRR